MRRGKAPSTVTSTSNTTMPPVDKAPRSAKNRSNKAIRTRQAEQKKGPLSDDKELNVTPDRIRTRRTTKLMTKASLISPSRLAVSLEVMPPVSEATRRNRRGKSKNSSTFPIHQISPDSSIYPSILSADVQLSPSMGNDCVATQTDRMLPDGAVCSSQENLLVDGNCHQCSPKRPQTPNSIPSVTDTEVKRRRLIRKAAPDTPASAGTKRERYRKPLFPQTLLEGIQLHR